EELAEICAEPNTTCGDGVGGASVGSVGGSTGGGFGGSSSGGTFNATGGAGVSNGGSFAANGGSGVGAAGGSTSNGGTGGQQPLAPGVCLQEDDILILYRDRSNGADSTSEPSMVLTVQNPGGAS